MTLSPDLDGCSQLATWGTAFELSPVRVGLAAGSASRSGLRCPPRKVSPAQVPPAQVPPPQGVPRTGALRTGALRKVPPPQGARPRPRSSWCAGSGARGGSAQAPGSRPPPSGGQKRQLCGGPARREPLRERLLVMSPATSQAGFVLMTSTVSRVWPAEDPYCQRGSPLLTFTLITWLRSRLHQILLLCGQSTLAPGADTGHPPSSLLPKPNRPPDPRFFRLSTSCRPQRPPWVHTCPLTLLASVSPGFGLLQELPGLRVPLGLLQPVVHMLGSGATWS
uniref:uncharacterized protein LOC129523134 n=1 Tax=Nyctereutes procyonoides TaxID=34880 RepID=UPI002443E49D|nr:uncharacterized protein LOC129523134 [Nyctereutes procyonoides]